MCLLSSRGGEGGEGGGGMGNSPPNELLPRKGAVAQINERLVEFVAAVAMGKEAE